MTWRSAVIPFVLLLATAQVPEPRFADYPVGTIFRGVAAAVDLQSASGARRFRTILQEGAKRGPNFAGHFTIVTWGCGSPCEAMAVVDAETGRVFFPGLTSVKGFQYRLDSRLLATEPLVDWIQDLKDDSAYVPLVDSVHYFAWGQSGAVQITAIGIGRDLLK